MTRVLVCWEDRFHDKLDLCLRRVLRRVGPDAAAPVLFFDDVRGNGGFQPFIARDWPKLVQHGLAKSGGPIDYLICIADADRASECCPIEKAPSAPAPTLDWVARADEAWTEALRRTTTLRPERVFGRFLRWNQESLLIALHDIEAVWRRAGCRKLDAIDAHLGACKPSPRETSDALFVEHFRKPSKCFDDLFKVAGVNVPRKGSSPRDDALEVGSQPAGIERLCARVPDLTRLAQHLLTLA